MRNAAVFITLIYSVSGFACTCFDPPKTFVENIKANHIIFSGIILEQLDVPYDSNVYRIHQAVTKIAVKKWYQNKMHSDTIYYANGSGVFCNKSIEGLNAGEEVIIKSVKESFYDPFFSEIIKSPIVAYDICDVSLLYVKGDKIIGDVTKSSRNQGSKFKKFIRRINVDWFYRLSNKGLFGSRDYQRMPVRRFDRIMRRLWKAM